MIKVATKTAVVHCMSRCPNCQGTFITGEKLCAPLSVCAQKTFEMHRTATWVQYNMMSLVWNGIEANAAFGAIIEGDGVQRSCEARLRPTFWVMSSRSHLEAYRAFVDKCEGVYMIGIVLLKRIICHNCPRGCHGDAVDRQN